MTIDLTQRSRPQLCTAVVESKQQLTKTIYLVNFRMQNPPTLSFLSGQTFSLHVGEALNRSMSISSPPSDPSHVLMCQDITPMGPGSKWTLAHNVGDIATFMAPLGIFILDKNSARKKVLVATGTGIAPYRSMLLDYFEHAGKQEITLYWGLRHEEDIYWKEEFEALAVAHANFHFVLTLSQPTEAWQGARGRVTDHVTQEENNHTESEFYLCGSKAMIRDVEAQLAQKEVPKKQIYKELYF